LKAILLGPESHPYSDLLGSKLSTPWELVRMEHPEPRQARAHDFGSAEALISVRFNRSFPFMPALKLLQAASTGINSILLDTVPAGVPVCNA
jgi:hypothetical protein